MTKTVYRINGNYYRIKHAIWELFIPVYGFFVLIDMLCGNREEISKFNIQDDDEIIIIHNRSEIDNE